MSLDLDRSGWSRVRFGDVVANVNDYYSADRDGVLPYVAGPHVAAGEPTVTSYGSTDDDNFPPTFKRKFQSGDVLLHSRGIEKLAVVDRQGVTGEKLFVLRSTEGSGLLQQFLPWLLMGAPAQRHMNDNFTGSVNKFLNWRPLANFEFELPPLDEQKRVADLLWSVEHHRDTLTELARSLKTSASRMIDDLRNSEHPVKPVGSIATVRNGQNYPKSMQDGREDDVPFFKVADLDRPGNERFLTNPGGWVTAEDVGLLSADILPAGTIVTARVGAAIKLERRRALAAPGLVDENHLVIRPFGVDSDYLLAVLSETKLARSSNDGVVPSLNQRIVGSVEVPSISADAETRVGAAYRAVGDAGDVVHSELGGLGRLRGSLLNAVFGGS